MARPRHRRVRRCRSLRSPSTAGPSPAAAAVAARRGRLPPAGRRARSSTRSGRPAAPWCPGNRGIEYATAPGTPVRAAADGRRDLRRPGRRQPLRHGRSTPTASAPRYSFLAGRRRRRRATGRRRARSSARRATGSTSACVGGDAYLDPGPAVRRRRARLVPAAPGAHRRRRPACAAVRRRRVASASRAPARAHPADGSPGPRPLRGRHHPRPATRPPTVAPAVRAGHGRTPTAGKERTPWRPSSP